MESKSTFPFRIIAILVAVLSVGLFVLLNYNETENTFFGIAQQSDTEMSGMIATGKQPDENVQTAHKPINQNAQSPSAQVLDITLEGSPEPSTQMSTPSIWEVVQTVSAQSNESTHWPKDQSYTEVTIDTEQIRSLEAGAKIALPIPELSKRFPGNVAEKTAHENGDTSITGYIEGYDDEYPFILTVGGNKVFATIETPDGSYMIESNATSTRIISVAELEKDIDYSRPDYKIKEEYAPQSELDR